MAKALLFEAQRAGDTILKAETSKSYTTERFDVKIFGPDDRRFDKALGADKSLKKDLAAACAKAFQKYVQEMARFLGDQAKAREKLGGAERKKFDQKFSGPLHTAGQAAFAKLETLVTNETKKRWKETAADNPKEYSAVRFEPIIVDFLPAFQPIAEPAEAEAEEEPSTDASEAGTELLKTQIELNFATAELKEAIAATAKVAEWMKTVNETVDAVLAAYKNAPRESQQDDERTEASEEPDENALNEMLYARFGQDIKTAETAAVDCSIAFSGDKGARGASAAAVKSLNKAIKHLAAVAKTSDARGTRDAVEANLDALGDAVKKLLAIQSDARVGARLYEESWLVFKTIREKKGAALELIDKARVTGVESPNARLTAAAEIIKKNRVSAKPAA